MNQTLKDIYDRKSVRVFEDRAISTEDKHRILEAAIQAPTAGNQGMFAIIDVTDPELKQKLAETCDHQKFIATAPMVLAFCADYQRWYDAYVAVGCQTRKPGVGDLLLAVTDTMIAAQNAVTAAESLGIGSCYIGDIMENCEAQRELLRLPEYVMPVGMVIFGYPTQQQQDRPKPERVKMEYIVHENGYTPLSSHRLEEMWTPRAGEKGYTDWMQAFCNRKYNSDFAREMTRSVSKYLQQYESI